MRKEQVQGFYQRIDRLDPERKALFGKMNCSQMVCHCTDQLRLAMGTKMSTEYGKVDPDKMILLAKSGKTVPTPKGFGQVEGEGSPPTDFENDRNILKEHILKFSELKIDFDYSPHPYFGAMDKNHWVSLVIYHLNYHLSQFDV